MVVRIIANPVAGGGLGETTAAELAECLSGRVGHVDLRLTRGAGDGARLAAEPGADTIVVVGGDGSLNEVVNGVGDMATTVGILPVGTANVVANELESPHTPNGMADLVAERPTLLMDAGLYEGGRFLMGAGAGLDAAVVERVSAHRGKRSGLYRWVWPTISVACTYRFPLMRITVEGDVLTDEAQYAVVGNCRFSAGVFPTTPHARIDDGRLDVLAFRNLGPVRLLSLTVAVWWPSFIERRYAFYTQGTSVQFEPVNEQRVPLQIDGDPAGTIPATFGIEPKAVRMLTPRGSQSAPSPDAPRQSRE